MGEAEVGEFLTYLAVERNVAASTQNQALSAILFLYKVVLDRPLERVEDVLRAKKPQRLPVVFTREEVRTVLARMQGDKAVMGSLLYGSVLRLMECLRLRVKDVDFGQNHIVVRDGKGQKDRVTVLPGSLVNALRRQVERVVEIHRQDLRDGFGRVYLPFALAKKYPNADREPGWQYLFPASSRAMDPRGGVERRHHQHEAVLERAESKKAKGSVATALAVLPTNRLRADSKATDHFERGIQDLILALSTCRLERRRSGCVAAMFHQCPQRASWPPRRAPRARESGCGFGKVTSGSRHQRDISGAKRSVVPSHRGWGRATTLLSVLEVRHGSLDSTPAQD